MVAHPDIEGIGFEDLMGVIQQIKTNQAGRIRKLVTDYADSFNIPAEEALKQIFPEEMQSITEKPSGIKPKYVNPEDMEQTWSGRGRLPKWMEPWLDKGYEKDDFLIENISKKFNVSYPR